MGSQRPLFARQSRPAPAGPDRWEAPRLFRDALWFAALAAARVPQLSLGPFLRAKMPALHIEDLPEKEKLKLEVEQLRKEVKLQRQQVSKCSEEIKNYIEERSGEDPLVKGIPEDKNPFKEKGSCIIS